MKKTNTSNNVLVIGDTHCPAMLPEYVDFLQDIQESWGCDRVVHIGDLVDWASISYHPKAPSLKNSEAEFEHAAAQVADLYAAFPEADWLIGNHDSLTERQATDLGLPLNVLKDYDELWGVQGWTVHPRYADLIIDGVCYRHGDKGKGGSMPAFMNAKTEFQSVVQGHFHASAGVLFGANINQRFFGMQVGSGVDYRKAAMAYGVKYSSKPLLGCGVVIQGETPIFEPMLLENKMGILS
jgi:predicted phosphodiesterase